MSIDPNDIETAYHRRYDTGDIDGIVHTHTEAAQEADTVPAADVLPAEIAAELPHPLYSHQASALRSLDAGNSVSVATPTASGKTLVYALEYARRRQHNPDATALFVYPMKALTQDQQDSLNELYKDTLGLDIEIGVYDGDTESGRKREIRKKADVVLTNFAGLNRYLSYHGKWARIYRNLELIAIDESHQYSGVHGMHVGWIVRRLKRVLRQYGGDPAYVLTTATIGNPIDHAKALTGEEVEVVDVDGSQQGARDIAFWNPIPASGEEGGGSVSFTANQLTAILAERGIQTLMFADSRTMTEVGQRRVGEELTGATVDAQSYHAGHGKRTRRETEQGLQSGDLNAVISTSALELGIDVGGLDATVLSGYPGSRQAFWQRIGRAGRGDERSVSILVAGYKSIDQYVINNPEYVFGESVENAVIDLSNNKVYAQHILCAANELPLTWEDTSLLGGDDRLEAVVDMWTTDGLLDGSLDWGVSYVRTDRPEADINLYATSQDDAFDVRVHGDETIDHDPVERVRAYRDFHEGAVVLHRGNNYVVEKLNENAQRPYILLRERPAIDHYTKTQQTVAVENIESREHIDAGPFTIHRGDATVTRQFPTYECRGIKSNDLLDHGETGTPPVKMDTQVMWVEPTDEFAREMLTTFAPEDVSTDLYDPDENHRFALSPQPPEDADGGADSDHNNPLSGNLDQNSGPSRREQQFVLGGLHAAEHAMIGVAPLTMMMEKSDLGGLSAINYPEIPTTTGLFVYDGIPGGVGFSHDVFDRLSLVAGAAEDLIRECDCGNDYGCPACSVDENCGDDNEPLHNPAAVWFLQRLQEALDETDNADSMPANQ